MDNEEFSRFYIKQKSILNDCKVMMDNLGENEASNEVEGILVELNNINSEHLRALAALESMPTPESTTEQSKTTEELFETALQSIPVEEFIKTHSSFLEEEELGDKSLVLSQIEGIPRDPISQCRIKIPARNKLCGHIYEYDNIITYIRANVKGRSRGIKCPHIGCTNATIKEDHIVKDMQLRRKIIAMGSIDDADNNLSVVDLE